MSSKQWADLLGYQPNAELKRRIFALMRDESLTLTEACQRYSLPEIVILDEGDIEPEITNRKTVIIRT